MAPQTGHDPFRSQAPEPITQVQSVWLLAFASLGVVFGDIGTSPLYAVKECFHPHFGLEPTPSNVLGICSLIFWSLTLVISIKHLIFVVRADNNGEGGTMALLALITPKFSSGHMRLATRITVLTALVGAALFAADGTITPAISVLSAVEGLEVATPAFKPIVVPFTVMILVSLFWVQKQGTARMAALFAPAMLVWFGVIALLGLPHILQRPEILLALNPSHALDLLTHHGRQGFLVLGAVVLCITGGEALYADMGHFGRGAIRRAWFPLVMPALIVNYFGQGALLLEKGAAVADNPFFGLVNGWMVYPLVALATLATVIASQALISGSFSVAQQAVQLGFSPRLTVVHTSGETKGQIYVPEINAVLMVTCIGLVLVFRDSSALAGAYGISVMGTMIITSSLMFVVARKRWKWPTLAALAMLVAFLSIEIPYFLANLPKIIDGGWFSLLICGLVFTIMSTWKRGRAALMRRVQAKFFPVKNFVERVKQSRPPRVAGTAVFMTQNPRVIPLPLLHHFKHNQVLHEKVLLLAVVTEEVPEVPADRILEVHDAGEGIFEVVAHYGFMQQPKVGKMLRLLRVFKGINTEEETTTYYLGRDTLLTSGPETMWQWRKSLFAFLMRNALPATAYFGLPPDRVVELGMQVEL